MSMIKSLSKRRIQKLIYLPRKLMLAKINPLKVLSLSPANTWEITIPKQL